MDAKSVIKIRDMIHSNNQKVTLGCDNSWFFYEDLDSLIWDDENEIVYCFRRAEFDVHGSAFPGKSGFVSFTYEFIQYIESTYNVDVLDNFLNTIGIISEERKKKIIEFYGKFAKNLSEVKPGTLSKEDLYKERPDLKPEEK